MMRVLAHTVLAAGLFALLTGCAGYQTGNGLNRLDTKSFWYSGYGDDEIGGGSDAGGDF